MIGAIVEGLDKIELERVTITLYQRPGLKTEDLNVFYEQAVALAAVASGKKGLYENIEELSRYVEARGGHELQTRFRNFRSLLFDDSPVDGLKMEDLYSKTKAIAGDTKNAARDTDWDTRELERKLLQTKYAGCMAQLNIQVSHLNTAS
jgi:hypothetical protein